MSKDLDSQQPTVDLVVAKANLPGLVGDVATSKTGVTVMDIETEVAQLPKQEQAEDMAGGLPGAIGSIINWHLGNYVYPNNKGWVFNSDTDFKLPGFEKPKQPDVAFVSVERLKFPDPDAVTVAPDLAVEVVSKSDSTYDTEIKAADYLKAGVQMVWLVRPMMQVVEVYQTGKLPKFLTIADELEGGDVLPGFKLKINDIFRGIPAVLFTGVTKAAPDADSQK